MNKRTTIFAYFLSLLLFSCSKKTETLFESRSDSGIDFVNTLSPKPTLNILNYLYYYNGAGVAAADFDNDGFTDLYFTSNQEADKLYRNKGQLSFEDITAKANIDNDQGWTTGVTNVDINHDGWMDIYVCKVGDFGPIKGRNLLYINQGKNADGLVTFKEDAQHYGLDIVGFATQAAFFDADLDGDLDLFLLNHSVFPNSMYGKGEKRQLIDSLSGDRFFINEGGKFTDSTAASGIFQGSIGYGLGVSTSDINNDGYPDIYVGNDFFENDYLYINQHDGSFKEVVSNDIKKLGHTSHFSMGNDIADLDNNGRTDIVSLDMLPEDIETYKASGTEYPFQTYEQYLKNGYAPQYMQNTLHLNLGETNFSEVAHASNMAATEWSWAPLIADFDNDGHKDLYITNGIVGASNDMDFINFIANKNIQEKIGAGMTEKEMAFAEALPQKKIKNYFFRNTGNASFDDVTEQWNPTDISFSNGAVYSDLDNDGDLDVVVNNINEPAFVLENKTSQRASKHNYLQVQFEGSERNPFGIGAKVFVYSDSLQMVQENFVTRGYLSAKEPGVHFGLGKKSNIDSITVVWPDQKFQTLTQVAANQKLKVTHDQASGNFYTKENTTSSLLSNVAVQLEFTHQEHSSYEFNRDPLIPFGKGNEGPNVSIADVNGDALDDVFIGGAKKQAAALFLQQKDGLFVRSQEETFQAHDTAENIDNLFFDADGDGDQDLIVVNGGNEFKTGETLQPQLFLNTDGNFARSVFPEIVMNASVVKAIDFDKDGDQDIVIGSNMLPQKFGETAQNYLFVNDGNGNFTDATKRLVPSFSDIGLIEDIGIIDIDKDGYLDMITAGHWMPISIFLNQKGNGFILEKNNQLSKTHGWWNSIIANDFDQDGDIDFIAGNWGLNTRLSASEEQPITLYRNDFDSNQATETLVTYYYQGKETPFASKDELSKQIPALNKKYLSYNDFAKASITDLFEKATLQNSLQKKVYELASCYFQNNGDGTFTKIQLPFMTQISTINAMYADDFNQDGFTDVLIAGNNYEISTQLGRLDASHGLLLLNDNHGYFNVSNDPSFDISGPARAIDKVHIGKEPYYIITRNNNTPIFLKKNDIQ